MLARFTSQLTVLCAAAAMIVYDTFALANEPSSTKEIRFQQDVLPIFRRKCTKCHSSEVRKADLADPSNRLPVNGVENWQSGYLPPIFQGTPMQPTGSPILNLQPEYEETAGITQMKRNLLAKLDRNHRNARPRQSVLDARIKKLGSSAECVGKI